MAEEPSTPIPVHKTTSDGEPIPDKNELTEAHETLKKLEVQSGGSVDIKHDEELHRKRKIDTEEQYAQSVRTGSKSSVLFVCTTFLIVVTGLFFVSPMILLVNNKEQLVNDLNDGFYAYHTYTDKVLGMQMGGGCGDKTIKCKFKTMSPMLEKRFKRYGFTVNSQELSNKRFSVSRLELPNKLGAVSNEKSLSDTRTKNAQADELLDRVYSARTGVFQDQKFYKRLQDQFGLEQANTVSGETAAEYEEDFDRRINEGDNRYEDRGDSWYDDTIDANGRGTYSLASLAEKSDRWRDDIYPNLTDKANTHLALACAYTTYGRMAENSLRKAKITTLARFAMNYLSLADDLKAGTVESGGGDTNALAVEVLAGKLMTNDKNQRNAMDGDSYMVPALGTTMSQSSGMNLSVLSLLQAMPGAPSLLTPSYLKDTVTNSAVQTMAPSRTPDGMCAQGMAASQAGDEQARRCYMPASLPLATYLGVATAAEVTAAKDPIERAMCNSLKSVVELVKTAAIPEVALSPFGLPMQLWMTADAEAEKYTSKLTGVTAQDAIFAGAGTILGDRAQSLGMRPASLKTLKEYLGQGGAQTAREREERRQQNLAMQKPWDATNPYSFVGKIVNKVLPASSSLAAGAARSSVSTVLSLLPTSLATAFSSSASALYTQPLHDLRADRFQTASKCGIGEASEFDTLITPDMGCNLRYSMSKDELEADLNQVLDYMTRPHPENAKETLAATTGRDMEADSQHGALMRKQATEGANKEYIDPKTGKPNNFTEYAKYMEYCVNRADPWGGVGLVVQPTEDTDKLAERLGDTSYISGFERPSRPNEHTVADSYYALAWGAPGDQDWYTGKRCVDDNPKYAEMLKNFRAYTMACGILADLSGAMECWDSDKDLVGHDDFYTSNNIIFKTAGN